MSLSGSPLSDRSTNRMFGLAETDSVWTALRSPPLLTFSGDQPCSTAIGRSSSAVASSQTKAVNGIAERRRARGVEGRVHCRLPPSWWSCRKRPAGRSAGVRDRRGSRGRRSIALPLPGRRWPRTRSSGSAIIAARLRIGRAAVIGAGRGPAKSMPGSLQVGAAGHAARCERLATTRTDARRRPRRRSPARRRLSSRPYCAATAGDVVARAGRRR